MNDHKPGRLVYVKDIVLSRSEVIQAILEHTQPPDGHISNTEFIVAPSDIPEEVCVTVFNRVVD